MELVRKKEKNLCVLSISGKINVQTSADLKKEVIDIADSGESKIYLDFSNVEFVNSSGLGSLINLLKELRKKDVALYIVNPSDFIKSLFELTHLDQIFTSYNNIEEAINDQN